MHVLHLINRHYMLLTFVSLSASSDLDRAAAFPPLRKLPTAEQCLQIRRNPAPRDITPTRLKETRPMTFVLFRDFTHRRMVAYYRCFSTTSRSNLQGSTWPLKTGPRGLPETSVRNYHCTVCNIPISRTARLADHPLNNRKRKPTSINHACQPFNS